MALMTAVMTTHEQLYLVVLRRAAFLECFLPARAPFMEAKHDQGRQLLEQYRRNEIPDFDGDDWMTPEYLAG